MIVVPMTVAVETAVIPMTVQPITPTIPMTVGVMIGKEPPAYEGDYNITPTEEEQVLNTDGLMMLANVVIGMIPENYGLITYDGTKITVS